MMVAGETTCLISPEPVFFVFTISQLRFSKQREDAARLTFYCQIFLHKIDHRILRSQMEPAFYCCSLLAVMPRADHRVSSGVVVLRNRIPAFERHDERSRQISLSRVVLVKYFKIRQLN